MRLRVPVALTLPALLLAAGCSRPEPPATYVGGDACVSCHKAETALWLGSDHDLAMDHATDSTVLGDFSGVTVPYAGMESTFYRDGDRFMARTEGPEGMPEDYEVLYVFGVRPLQQYLVAFPGGRLQALPFAWDTRPEGARWFHLYPDDAVTVRDPLHWTGAFQNWNHMCADCHSTDLVKGYDPETRTFETTWKDIDVSCEACHGPGSQHVAWAKRRRRFPNWYPHSSPTDSVTEKAMGLVVSVRDQALWSWRMDLETGTAARTRPRGTVQDIPTCGRCHSRRASLWPSYPFDRPFEDTHLAELPVPPLYYADGQVLDEDYVYASFRQSRMGRAGVTCMNCHDAHNLRVRADGNDLCASCHLPSRFDVREHHGHRPGTPGALCVDCHMPETTYMVVDARRDHSFSTPRPALSRETGVPNACTGCHTDRTDDWAVAELAKLGQRPESPAFALAYHAADIGARSAEDLLLGVVRDTTEAGNRRAGALRLLAPHMTTRALPVVNEALRATDPSMRWAALGLLTLYGADERARLGAPLLRDSKRSVRMEAARVLAGVDVQGMLSGDDRVAFDRAIEEYLAFLRMDADRPEAQTNLGLLRAAQGDAAGAEEAFLEAITLSPWFASAYVNLADLYRATGRDAEGLALLSGGLEHLPESADLHHALGLARARLGQTTESLASLERAARLRPDEVRFGYVHAVALNSAGRPDDAVRALERMLSTRPAEPELLFLLATIHRDRAETERALDAARRLAEAAPDDPRGAALVEQLTQ